MKVNIKEWGMVILVGIVFGTLLTVISLENRIEKLGQRSINVIAWDTIEEMRIGENIHVQDADSITAYNNTVYWFKNDTAVIADHLETWIYIESLKALGGK